MKSLCIIVASVAFVAFVKTDTATQSPVDKLVAEALGSIEAGAQKFQELTGIKTEFDKVKAENSIRNGLGDSKKKIEEIIKSLESNSFSENFKKNVETLSKQLNQTVENFKSSSTQGNMEKLKETFEDSLKKILNQGNEVAKSAGVTPSPEIQKNLNAFFEEIGKGAKAVQEKLQQAINEAQKKSP